MPRLGRYVRRLEGRGGTGMKRRKQDMAATGEDTRRTGGTGGPYRTLILFIGLVDVSARPFGPYLMLFANELKLDLDRARLDKAARIPNLAGSPKYFQFSPSIGLEILLSSVRKVSKRSCDSTVSTTPSRRYDHGVRARRRRLRRPPHSGRP